MTAQRLYLPQSGTPVVSPAFGGLWGVTGTATRRPLRGRRSDTANANIGVSETSGSLIDGLITQFISDDTLVEGFIPAATFVLAVRMYETNNLADAFLQATIRVVSNDGTVERGVLYAGQTATSVSTNPADPNYELAELSQDQRVLPGTLASGVYAQRGDRIVLEVGARFCNSSTSNRTANFTEGDLYTDADLDGSPDGAGTVAWIEFDQEVIPRRRFYFASSGAVLATPAFGSQWEDTNDAVRHPLVEVRGGTALTQLTTSESNATLTDMLSYQFISDRAFPGGLVDLGAFAACTKANQDTGIGNNAYLQVVIRAVSADGSVERGVFYSGQPYDYTANNGSGSTNEAFTTSAGLVSPRIVLVSDNMTGTVETQPGDLLVVEIGARCTDTVATPNNIGITTGSTDRGDLPWVAGQTNVQAPWIEFSNAPFAYLLPRPPINLAATPDETSILFEWDPPVEC